MPTHPAKPDHVKPAAPVCMQNNKKRPPQQPDSAPDLRKRLSQLLIDVFLPAEIHYDKNIAFADKLVYYGVHGLFFLSIVILLFEITCIDNTIHGMSLVWGACFTGILVAAALLLILNKTNPAILYERKMRNNLIGAIALGCVFLSMFVASFINHRFAGVAQNCRSFTIESKAQNKRRGGCWLYLKVGNGNEERFEVSYDLFNAAKEGGQVVLCTRKGALGFDFVTEFRLAD